MARKLTDNTAFEGETLTESFAVPAEVTALAVTLTTDTAQKTIAATKAAGADTWNFKATKEDLAGLTGSVRWIAMATSPDGDEVFAESSIYIRPLRSKWREVVAAIDECLKSWDTNPNHTVQVGEITITAKTRQDLMSARSFWVGRADADERGSSVSSGPRIVHIIPRG